MLRSLLLLPLLWLGSGLKAQDIEVFDDTLRNGFVPGYSYGGGVDLQNVAPTRGASLHSIAFTPSQFNALAFANEARSFSTAEHDGLRLYVHGGSADGQSLRLQVYRTLGGAPALDLALDPLIAGGAVVAGEWREVSLRFADLDPPFEGSYQRIDLQAANGPAQPTLFVDDVVLLATSPLTAALFANGFEAGSAPPRGSLRFASASFHALESAGSAQIEVVRTGGSAGAVSVQLVVEGSSATAGADFSGGNVTVSWADGESGSKFVPITLVDDDALESDETVGLMLANPAGGATLGSPAGATLTLVEPDLLLVPRYDVGDSAGSELGLYRRTPAGFVLRRNVDLGSGLLVNALRFAPDGALWVIDNSDANRRLLRYALADLLQPAPQPQAVVTPVGRFDGQMFDLAFFGDAAYVSQSNFVAGGVNRILRLSLAQMAGSGSPTPVALSHPSLHTPAGLAFDAQGRLWISNFSNHRIVRMNVANGSVDRIGESVAVGPRASLSAPEGLAFDAEGTLWVGNNGQPTLAAYAAWQLDDPGFGATAPVHLHDIDPLAPPPDFVTHTGYVGGLAFDREGGLRANYQFEFAVRGFSLASGGRPGGLPGVGSYALTPLPTLDGATTDPGFGGLALWPVPETLHRSVPPGPAQFRGTTLVGMETSYQFFDAAIGPIEGTHYPRFDEVLVDYFADKGMNALRILVCWEAMQSSLMGPIPAQPTGHYRTYFDNYLRVVDYATRVRGMTVLVTPWQVGPDGGIGGARWRGELVGSAGVPIAAWQDFWSRLATLFADNPRVEFVLVTEPHGMPTLDWWAIAQAGIDAIRGAGATQRIHVPGNGYTAASSWTSSFYDTGPAPKRSNAYGWLNANGPGQPISDPLGRLAAEVHTYLDADQSGSSDAITAITAARQQLAATVDEARARGYQVYLGEIGLHAANPLAAAAWADFIDYFEANSDVLVGFTWWAGGHPLWWSDVGANGGGHYSISPTDPATYSGDTINMDLIEDDF